MFSIYFIHLQSTSNQRIAKESLHHYMKKQRIVLAVTNDLSYDQRMQRICSSLSDAGYDILLVGRKRKDSIQLHNYSFQQKRLYCIADKGFAFYVLYNIRLFFFLLFCKADALCAIDLDTILPVYLASVIRNKKHVYDAHELFTEQKEIVTRKFVYHFWLILEKILVPKFKYGYTVNLFIAEELERRYGVKYEIVRNLPVYHPSLDEPVSLPATQKFILYQGAVNEGRGFETLIPAMKEINAPLVVCGKGNFYQQLEKLIAEYHVEDKVILKGLVLPHDLKKITPAAYFGLTLFEATGLNQYYSLSNRFFDYIMAGIPQVCVGYPEYKAINNEYEIALLVNDIKTETLVTSLNNLLDDDVLYNRLKKNCLTARERLNWNNEEKKLITFWKNICIL